MPPGPCSAPCSGRQWLWRAGSPRPAHMSPSAPPPAGTGGVSPGGNGGSSVLACARPAWLAGTGSAATPRSRGTRGEPRGDCTGTGTWGRLGPAALALARRAASLQKPARSQQRCWGDPKGSPPPPIACSPQPLCPRRASSHPYLFVLFQQLLQLLLFLLLPLAVIFGGSQLEEEGLVQSPPCHPPSS